METKLDFLGLCQKWGWSIQRKPTEILPGSLPLLRKHLRDIVRAGIVGASAQTLTVRALENPAIRGMLDGRSLTLVAAGKAATPMASTFLRLGPWDVRGGLVAGPEDSTRTETLEWYGAGHPLPNGASIAAGRRALELASCVDVDGVLLVLLSGGASATLAAPLASLTLTDKVETTRTLLKAGVAIDGINCVRKHLSAIKGGRLAAATKGSVVTLAISDVVGKVSDDPAVIGSGPTVGDPTSFEEAVSVIEDLPKGFEISAAAHAVLEQGRRGEISETPKPGDLNLLRSQTHIIGNRLDAVRGVRTAAEALGYAVATIDVPVIGDARTAARDHVAAVATRVREMARPACIVSAGETTVQVTGSGQGGRNQEFALAAVSELAARFDLAVLASVGTDGVDGPTDAAGAMADVTTEARSLAAGLPAIERYLQANDSYNFFAALGDLIYLGSTDTNVGDLQVVLIGS